MRVQEIVLTIIIFFLSFSILLGQDDEYVTDYQPIRYEDYVYKPSIKTALLHIDGLLTSQPILQLNQPIQMRLSFDDIAEEVVDYYYTIIAHVNVRVVSPGNLVCREACAKAVRQGCL